MGGVYVKNGKDTNGIKPTTATFYTASSNFIKFLLITFLLTIKEQNFP